MIKLSDQDLLSRLTNFEDAFVERKSSGDMKDLLKTAVAFANSTPMGYPAILFYGVTNEGVPEGKANLDTMQRTISDKLSDAYPPIYYLSKVLQQDGKQFLAVIIPGSENRPHFAGQSYVRDGTQTKKASEQQFERLIAERNSKAREIVKWLGKEITFRIPKGQHLSLGGNVYENRLPGRVMDCNQFYVSLRFVHDNTRAYALSFVEIGYDYKENRLEVIGLPGILL